MSKIIDLVDYHTIKTSMNEDLNSLVLLVQPLGENPQNPARHASQFRPPTPGLQEH